MSKQLTLGFVPYGTGQHRPFDAVFPRAKQIRATDVLDGRVDAVVIWGGADISPSIYGELPSVYSGAATTLSARDKVETDVMRAAVQAGIPIIGVCRGAQLACAIAGGKLVQHVDGHHEDHTIVTEDGERLVTSSVHHQMMYPFDIEHHMIARSAKQRSREYWGAGWHKVETMPKAGEEVIEPEIVYFPTIKALAIQGHPEFMRSDCEFVTYCNKLVRKYLLGENV